VKYYKACSGKRRWVWVSSYKCCWVVIRIEGENWLRFWMILIMKIQGYQVSPLMVFGWFSSWKFEDIRYHHWWFLDDSHHENLRVSGITIDDTWIDWSPVTIWSLEWENWPFWESPTNFFQNSKKSEIPPKLLKRYIMWGSQL
jgi:hypothetical protein